jgi:hypothetical protein
MERRRDVVVGASEGARIIISMRPLKRFVTSKIIIMRDRWWGWWSVH